MIEINWTLGVQAANFLVSLVFLNHFIFKPMLAHIDKREAAMKKMRDEAEVFRKKGEDALAEYENGLEKIRVDTTATVAEARRKAQEGVTEKIATSRKEFEAKIEVARAKIKEDTESASATLQAEISQFARSMAGKILGRGI
ncbi:MAG: ATP synthase F0 subunit B [Nitrospinota bacterium]|nr:ATP synthase F0 subunit B [Nitrospinota bacterium]